VSRLIDDTSHVFNLLHLIREFFIRQNACISCWREYSHILVYQEDLTKHKSIWKISWRKRKSYFMPIYKRTPRQP